MSSGHDQDAGHGADACCTVPDRVPTDAAFRRVLWIALALNAAMFGTEVIAGLTAGSVALQADALDFLSDSASYAITLLVLGRAPRWRTVSALIKGVVMLGFGLWVVAATVISLIAKGVPDPAVMGSVGVVAFAVNVLCAVLLFRHRGGDANARSIWLCSRNDAIGNLAVLAAASGVFATGTGWPDLAVAAVMAGLALYASIQVIAHAASEWRAGGIASGNHVH